MTERYQCDTCGACCRQLIVEVWEVDLLREPRLREACITLFKTEGDDEEPDAPAALLACGSGHPCRMLGEDNRCAIYPTRPTCCVAFEAGSEQCQDARRRAGLPLLAPVAEGASAARIPPDQRDGEAGNNASGHEEPPPR